MVSSPELYEFADSASISHFDFFDTVGTGIAANTIVSGTYQPANPLAAFLGESATGIWTISFDDTAPGDSGQVFNLELNIAIPEPSRALLLCLGLVGLVLRRQR
ncbi:MAG: PEP-CTERM sorting domain-containing protein [Verrucomicrobiales bacterium]